MVNPGYLLTINKIKNINLTLFKRQRTTQIVCVSNVRKGSLVTLVKVLPRDLAGLESYLQSAISLIRTAVSTLSLSANLLRW